MDRTPFEMMDPMTFPGAYARAAFRLEVRRRAATERLADMKLLTIAAVVTSTTAAVLAATFVTRDTSLVAIAGSVACACACACALSRLALVRPAREARLAGAALEAQTQDSMTLARLEAGLAVTAFSWNAEVVAWNLAAAAGWHSADEEVALVRARQGLEAGRLDMLATAVTLRIAGRVHDARRAPESFRDPAAPPVSDLPL